MGEANPACRERWAKALDPRHILSSEFGAR